jgi:O-antigen ligase
MQLIKPESRNLYIVYFVGFLFVVLNSVLIYFEVFYLPVLPIVLAIAWIAFSRLDRLIYLIVFFVPLSIPLSEFLRNSSFDLHLPTEPLLAGVLLIYFLKYLKGEKINIKILRHPVTLAIYFNLAWIFITSITSTMPLVSFKFLVARIWFIISFYLIAAQIFQEPRRIRQYLWAYIIPFTLVIIYVLIRHSEYGLNNQVASHWVVKPFYNDHTSYGAILAMLLPALIGLFLSYKRMDSGQTILFLLLIVLFGAATVFSYTRAAWVSLVGIAGIWIIIRLRIKLSYIIAGAILLSGLFFSLRTELIMKLEQNKQESSGEFSEHVQSITNVTNDASNLERLNRWNCAIRMWKEKPVFGWGPGTYMFQYAPFQVSHERTRISTNAGTRGNAHSEYLGPLSESGVLGFFSILLIFSLTVITGLRVYFNSKNPQVRVISLSILLGLITYYIHGVLNNFLDTDKASALVWGFSAILVAFDVWGSKGFDEKISNEKTSES